MSGFPFFHPVYPFVFFKLQLRRLQWQPSTVSPPWRRTPTILLTYPLPGSATPPDYFPIDMDANHINLPASVIQKESRYSPLLQSVSLPDLVPVSRKTPLSLAVRGFEFQHQSIACVHIFKKQKTSNSNNTSFNKIDQQHAMLAAKKLSLVLDLDHTLLHTVKFSTLKPPDHERMREEEAKECGRPQRHLFCIPHLQVWTKLRPGIWTFLYKASQLFELHICTMGHQLYAEEMAKLLDPSRELFGGRVVSKRESTPKVKDLKDVLGTESAAVIIDDTVEAWPKNKPNLIHAEHYTMSFSRDSEEAGTLASLYTVIERIHHKFFSNPVLSEVDVRTIIAAEKRKVLAGCRVHINEAEPNLYSLGETTQLFGAKCTTRMDNFVTHVLSRSLATDEAKWALSTGKFVVNHKWVEASAFSYKKANEKDFLPSIEPAPS